MLVEISGVYGSYRDEVVVCLCAFSVRHFICCDFFQELVKQCANPATTRLLYEIVFLLPLQELPAVALSSRKIDFISQNFSLLSEAKRKKV
jgi:hypothetical protein